MTSGSPPVLSISPSDHSFAGLASSFDLTLAHSRPAWRFIFPSKRAFSVFNSPSRCSGDNSFGVTPCIPVVFLLPGLLPPNPGLAVGFALLIRVSSSGSHVGRPQPTGQLVII